MPDALPTLNGILAQLTPQEHTLFSRHCIQGESLSCIAASARCSPASLQQSVVLLRKHLYDLLLQKGLDQKQAGDYLYRTLTNHG